MIKLLLRILIEVFVAVSLAGIVLALAIPVLNSSDSTVAIVVVLVAAVVIAVFRPQSALRRYIQG